MARTTFAKLSASLRKMLCQRIISDAGHFCMFLWKRSSAGPVVSSQSPGRYFYAVGIRHLSKMLAVMIDSIFLYIFLISSMVSAATKTPWFCRKMIFGSAVCVFLHSHSISLILETEYNPDLYREHTRLHRQITNRIVSSALFEQVMAFTRVGWVCTTKA